MLTDVSAINCHADQQQRPAILRPGLDDISATLREEIRDACKRTLAPLEELAELECAAGKDQNAGK